MEKRLVVLVYLMYTLLLEVSSLPTNRILDIPMETAMVETALFRYPRRAKPPSVATAPLDPNEALHNTLEEVNGVLGVLGGVSGQAVMGLTGISIEDCALSIKEEDLNKITCPQFIDKVSQCNSMSNLKPLLQQAKNKYKNKPNSRAPCFSRKGRKQG